jgi:hypothetical protein
MHAAAECSFSCVSLKVLENSAAHDSSAVTNPQAWVQSWAKLVAGVTSDVIAAPRIIISVLGNPDALGLKCALCFWDYLLHFHLACQGMLLAAGIAAALHYRWPWAFTEQQMRVMWE